MSYAELRDSIKDGDVLLFRGAKSRISAIIRWATRSSYSHAALALWVDDRLMVAESREFRGCRLVPASRAVEGAVVEVCRLDPRHESDLDRAAVRKEALSRLGEPYGWRSILRTAVGKLPLVAFFKARRSIGLGNKAYSEDDMHDAGQSVVCSTYVALCYRAGGIDLVPNLADRDTTPGDLARSALLAHKVAL